MFGAFLPLNATSHQSVVEVKGFRAEVWGLRFCPNNSYSSCSYLAYILDLPVHSNGHASFRGANALGHFSTHEHEYLLVEQVEANAVEALVLP